MSLPKRYVFRIYAVMEELIKQLLLWEYNHEDDWRQRKPARDKSWEQSNWRHCF
jgi:hypothetical protein